MRGRGPIAGDARIGQAPELRVHDEYHDDRNALRDSRRVGAYFVAPTEAGNVLAFTAAGGKPVRELVDPIPSTGARRQVHDAIPWRAGELLLATERASPSMRSRRAASGRRRSPPRRGS